MNIIISDLELNFNRTIFVKGNVNEHLTDFLSNILDNLACPTDYNDHPTNISFSSVQFELINGQNSLIVYAGGHIEVAAGDVAYFSDFSFSNSDLTNINSFENVTLEPNSTLEIIISVTGVNTEEGVDEQETTSVDEEYHVEYFIIDTEPIATFYSESNPLMIPREGTTFTPNFWLINIMRFTGPNTNVAYEDITDTATINSLQINYEYVKNQFDGAGLIGAWGINGIVYEWEYANEVNVGLDKSYFVWVEAENVEYDIDLDDANDLISIEANYDNIIPRGANYHADLYFKTVNGKKLNFKVYVRGVDVTASSSNYDSLGENEHITVDILNVNGDIVIESSLQDKNYVRWYDHNQTATTFYNYQVKEGWTYQDNFSEELDNATIIIRTTKTDFQPLDMIELGNFGSRTMIISSVIENKCNFIPKENNQELYDYVITLGSLTKCTERVTCPSFSYTKPFGVARKKISEVIEFVLNDYSPKIIVNGVKTNQYQFYDIYGFCNSTDCPDMTFEKLTLREVLDQLLSVVNCICTVEIMNNYLTIIPMWLNDQRGKLTEEQLSHFKYPQENQSIEDYASETENDYHNIMSDKYTLVTEYLHFTNEENTQITTNNMYLQTNYPIYDIKEFRMIQFRSDTPDNPDTDPDESQNTCYIKNFYLGLQEIEDAYNNFNPLDPNTWNLIPCGVVESQEYQLLQYINRLAVVRYSRGDNKIVGWNDMYPTTLLGLTEHEVWWWTTFLARDVLNRTNYFDTFAANTFKIQYYTLTENIRAKSGKLLPEPHNSTLINSQNSGFADMALQGNNFQDRVNRLGNRVKVLQGRFNKDEENLIPQLASNTGNLVVINRELTFFNNFIAVKLTLTENYVNINYFTGINARKRSWNLVNINETINKQLLDKWYCEFDFVRGNRVSPITTWGFQTRFINQALLSCFNESLQIIPSYAFIRTSDTYKKGGAPWIELELNKYVSGRSIIFHFKLFDNFSAGKFLLEFDDSGEYSNYSEGASSFQEYANYTTENGELTNNLYQIVIMDNNFINRTGHFVPYNEASGLKDSRVLDFLDYARQKPLTWLDEMNHSNIDPCVVYACDILNHKDSKESIEFNIQFEYCSATPDIIVTPLLAQRCKMVSSGATPALNYHLDTRNYYLNDKYYYHETGRDVNPDSINFIVANEGASANNKCTITVNNEIQDSDKALIITQTTNIGEEIVMVINNIREHTRGSVGGTKYIDFYMNMYRDNRDHKNYTTADMKNWTI